MQLTNSIESGPNGNSSQPNQRDIQGHSRVRTGCLICRSRKVKCDEKRPDCQRCTKAKRTCVYKKRPSSRSLRPAPPSVTFRQHQNSPAQETQNSGRPLHHHLFSAEYTSVIGDSAIVNACTDGQQPIQSGPANAQAAALSEHVEIRNADQAAHLNNAESPSARFYKTSMQMYITTALDFLAPPGLLTQTFSYFIEEVDSPILSPFDRFNWKRIKLHIAQLAIQNESITTAILAVQSVYRAQVNRLPMAHAISESQSALTTLELMVANDAADFEMILIVVLLLSLCEVILPNEDGPYFSGFTQAFETRLAAWLLLSNRSPISLRICVWLQLLHVASKRSGCCGLLPETTFNLLSSHIMDVPNLSPARTSSDSASAMYEIISAPIFTFYTNLQRISNEIQDLSHYRRSRITPEDQAEVAGIVTGLSGGLSALWDARPSPLRFKSSQLRQNFCQTIAEPLIALVGVCAATYYGEIVGLRRTLGDDPFPSAESEQAMRQIRHIVEGEWNGLIEGDLNPGYIRPLFMYSIETLRHDETHWAVSRLKQIRNPISRSGFIASLGDSLARAQRMEKRRVATKYFCLGTFNVMVPRM